MKESLKLILVLTGFALFSGGILAWFNTFTAEKVKYNKLMELKAGLREVVPAMKSYEKIHSEKDFEMYKIKGADGSLKGYAVVAQGNGYQDKIKLLFGLSKDLSHLYALTVLDQKETPGLGARIATGAYLRKWRNRSAKKGIQLVKGRAAKNKNEVEAITGATISSRSVVKIVNKGIEKARNLLGSNGS